MILDVSTIYSGIIADIQSRVPIPFATNISNSAYISETEAKNGTPLTFQTVLENYMAGNSDSPEISEAIEAAIKTASEKYGIDETLIKAVIQQESNFNPKSVSSSGAMGLNSTVPGSNGFF